MGMTGFNEEQIKACMDRINAAYEQLMQELQNGTQTKFVESISNHWACKEAQDFFNTGFKPAIDELIDNVRKTYDSVGESIVSAANSWAMTTGGSTTMNSAQSMAVNHGVDVSSIKENISGARGADVAEANHDLGTLRSIAESAGQALEATVQAVNDAGFLDPTGNQQQALTDALKRVKNDIESACNSLVEETQAGCKAAFDKYGDLSANIAGHWAGH